MKNKCDHKFEIWRGRDICIDCGEEKKYNNNTETGARSYGTMHDALCRQNFQPYEDDSRCPDCELIAAAYKRGYEDAVEDMKDDSV